MKKQTVKRLRTIKPAPKVKKTPTKPQVKLCKSDPNYYKKIGEISARRRSLNSDYFSEMARKSHGPKSKRDGYHGGRRKKDDPNSTTTDSL